MAAKAATSSSSLSLSVVAVLEVLSHDFFTLLALFLLASKNLFPPKKEQVFGGSFLVCPAFSSRSCLQWNAFLFVQRAKKGILKEFLGFLQECTTKLVDN
jgi:hypothetical protein